MGFVRVLSPTDWIIRITIGIVGLIITGSLLGAELIKRKSKTLEFQSLYLRYSSLSSMVLGVICSLLLILSVVPGFCMIHVLGSATMTYLQFLCLGLYQLSRLHYSFSKEQLHQKKGYPLWVFKVMIAVAIILWIGHLIAYFMFLTPVAKCGYRENGYFFYEYKERAILFDGDYYTDRDAATTFYTVWFTFELIGLLWDLTTLMLYLWKIWKIGIIHKSKVHGVWDNVLFILYRIVILTVFYEFCHFTTAILFPLLSYLTLSPEAEAAVAIHRSAAILMVSSAVESLAIFMMMEHNTTTYVRFLRFLRGFRLKYCCFCCWHRMVDQQLEVLLAEQQEATAPTGDTKGKNSKVSPTDTVFSNISKNVEYGLNVSSRNLSISTKTNPFRRKSPSSPLSPNAAPSSPVHHLQLPSMTIKNIVKIEENELEYAISDGPE